MDIQYNITKKDYIESVKLAAVATKKQFLWLCIVGLGLLFFALFGPKGIKGIGYLGLIGGVAGYFATLHVISPWQAKISYKNYKIIQDTITLTLEEDGYTMESINGTNEMKWENLLKWREDEKIVLVYYTPKIFHTVPKRLADLGFDIEHFRNLLQENLGAPV